MSVVASQILLKSLSYVNDSEKYNDLIQVKAEQWQQVIDLAHHHEIESLLYHRLKPLNLKLPEKLSTELYEDYLSQALKNLYLYRELGNLLEEMHANGLPVIVLKGAYLAEAVYENIGLRGMSDVDLMVRGENLEHAERIFTTKGGVLAECFNGLEPHDYHKAYQFEKSNLKVEIHWALHSQVDTWHIDLKEIWERTQTLTIANSPAFALAKEDLILYLCLHTAKHAPFHMHLRMVVDLGEIVRHFSEQIDWVAITTRARHWRLTRPVYLLLRLAKELLKTPVPEECLADLYPPGFDNCYLEDLRRLLLADRSEYFATNSGRVLRKIKEEREFKNKVNIIKKLFLPPEKASTNHDCSENANRRRYRDYYKRFVQVFSRYGKAVVGLLLKDKKTKAAASRAVDGEKLSDWLASG